MTSLSFINLTPHPILLRDVDPARKSIVFPSRGAIRLLEETPKNHGFPGEVSVANPDVANSRVKAVAAPQFAGVDPASPGYTALCAANPNTDIVLVSMPVGKYLTEHSVDSVARRLTIAGPNTGPGPDGAVRDEEGNIRGSHTIVIYGSTP